MSYRYTAYQRAGERAETSCSLPSILGSLSSRFCLALPAYRPVRFPIDQEKWDDLLTIRSLLEAPRLIRPVPCEKKKNLPRVGNVKLLGMAAG